MRKWLTIFAVAGAIAGLITILKLTGDRDQKNNGPIKVGIILPFTGDLAYIGEEIQRGIELGLSEHPDENIFVIYEDDKTFNLLSSVEALNKLINIDQVDIVFNSAVNTIKALAPILSSEKIPGVVIWDSNNETIESLGDYVFAMGYSTELAGQDMADFAYNKLGLRNISVLTNYDEWSELISRSFINKFEALGGRIDYHSRAEVSEIDFRSEILKIRNLNSNAIYFPLNPPSLSSFIRQAREQYYRGAMLSADGFTYNDIANLGNYSEGIYLTHVWLADTEFSQKYKDRFGQDKEPVSLAFVGLGYDAANFIYNLIVEMKRKGIPINSQNIRDALTSHKFSGVTGTVDFSKDRIAGKRESILRIRGSKLIRIK